MNAKQSAGPDRCLMQLDAIKHRLVATLDVDPICIGYELTGPNEAKITWYLAGRMAVLGYWTVRLGVAGPIVGAFFQETGFLELVE